jgi:lipopolysaccharide transport system permease protein/teichoic acid transport system permease protein
LYALPKKAVSYIPIVFIVRSFLFRTLAKMYRFVPQFIKEAIDFFYQIFLNRMLLFTLSIRDFQKKYISNLFGLVWAVLDPVAFVVILYFVFGERYSGKNPNEVSFVVYLITGHIAFDLFGSTMHSVTQSITEHSFLLKKVNFRVAILPIVTMLSNLMVHGIVLMVCIVILQFNHIYPSWYWFQLLYYAFAITVFLISIGWLTSSIYLFFPDISNIVAIVTRLMFFLTPIFWKMSGLAVRDQFLLKLNPVYYIVNGYRESLIYHKGFWEHPVLTVYFWSVCIFFLVIGVLVFKRLRPHFADVVQ